MAKYRHIKLDHFYQGLPTGEIDDSTLDTEQQALLSAAVAAGVYEPIPDAPSRKSRKDEIHDKPAAENPTS